MSTPIYLIPSRSDIESLKVGDMAINPFGKMMEAVDIYARGVDAKGRAWVLYYTAHGDQNGRISGSMTEGELVRTVPLTFRHTSAELDRIEREMNGGATSTVQLEIPQ